MGAFVFIIILLLVIVPRMRQESVRRTPYGKEHRGTQYGYRAAGKGGAQVQPAQYSYPAGAQAQGAAGTGGAPNPDAPGRQSNPLRVPLCTQRSWQCSRCWRWRCS